MMQDDTKNSAGSDKNSCGLQMSQQISEEETPFCDFPRKKRTQRFATCTLQTFALSNKLLRKKQLPMSAYYGSMVLVWTREA